MSDEQLEALFSDSYNPNEPVTIVVRKRVSRFSEDLYKMPRRRRSRTTTKAPKSPPSEQYGSYYEKWKQGEKEADAQAVLGCYFVFYRTAFDEEDPEWAGQSCVKPLYNINQMAHAVCDGDYTKLIEFLETIIPMWATQLRKGVDFPSTRPTVDALFVRRKIWAQRFNLYRRWKS